MAKTGSDYLSLGGGSLYVTPYVDGVLTGNQKMFGLTDTVELETSVTFVEKKNTEGKVPVTAKKLPSEIKALLKFTTGEISPAMIVRAFFGNEYTTVHTAKTDEATVITTISAGDVISTGYRSISTMLVKSSDDLTTYTENSDYTIDKNTGMFSIIAVADGGTIVDDSELHLTTTTTAFTSTNISALKGSSLEAKLVFVSDPQSGERYVYTFSKVSIVAQGSLALKSEEFASMEFEGEVLLDDSISPTGNISQFFDVETLPDA